ncbi:MAG: hypothetical protein SGPRY_004727 [Prymnesium sp.]
MVMQISAYEEKRAQSIAENQSELAKLGIQVRVPRDKRKQKEAGRRTIGTAPAGIKRVKLSAASLWAPLPKPSPDQSKPCHEMSCQQAEACVVCKETEDAEGNEILLCDGSHCGAAFHQKCLDPPLQRIPRGEWLCPCCQQKAAKAGLAPPAACCNRGSSTAAPLSCVSLAAGNSIVSAQAAQKPERLNHGSCPTYDASRTDKSDSQAVDESRVREWQEGRRQLLLSARASLHLASEPASMLCREEQCNSIIQFCREALAEGRGGAMYVCGSPGLGKSLTVRQAHEMVMRHLLTPYDRICFVNAFRLDSPATVYTTVYKAISGKSDAELEGIDAREALQLLIGSFEGSRGVQHAPPARRHCPRKELENEPGSVVALPTDSRHGKGMFVLLLDEIDQLLSLHQQVLYTLFEWAAAPCSRLVLIGIANALDLTERFLPRLRAHGATPEALHFSPYSDDELASIVKQRLTPAALALAQRNSNNVRTASQMAAAVAASCGGHTGADANSATSESAAIIETHAVVFSSKKVANASGDARRVLEVARLAVELALDELGRTMHALPGWASKPLIRFEHMASALSLAFKSPIVSVLSSLPQHQQVLMCAMVLRSRRIAIKAAAAAAAASNEASKADQSAAKGASNFLLQARPKASAKSSSKAAEAKTRPFAMPQNAVGIISSAGKKTAATATTTSNRCTLADLHLEVIVCCGSSCEQHLTHATKMVLYRLI